MKWTMQQLLPARQEPMNFDQVASVKQLAKEHQDVRAVSDVHIKGQIEAKRNVFSFTFAMSGTLTLPCARTLADVSLPFDTDVRVHFVLRGEQPPENLEPEDVYEYEGDVIDLLPVIEERILLEIPIQVFAENPNPSEVLAPPTGEGWELVTEEAKAAKVDPRLADLAKFLDEDTKK
ncbi:YceD family protein [Shouchella shacheensis]|uniref:YceD family protein n=1 Tax=Shouchella shacheensis TaxID=1649580 RepID=UPI00073FBD82|nr:YceD family protein [Shouchella shacheensis]